MENEVNKIIEKNKKSMLSYFNQVMSKLEDVKRTHGVIISYTANCTNVTLPFEFKDYSLRLFLHNTLDLLDCENISYKDISLNMQVFSDVDVCENFNCSIDELLDKREHLLLRKLITIENQKDLLLTEYENLLQLDDNDATVSEKLNQVEAALFELNSIEQLPFPTIAFSDLNNELLKTELKKSCLINLDIFDSYKILKVSDIKQIVYDYSGEIIIHNIGESPIYSKEEFSIEKLHQIEDLYKIEITTTSNAKVSIQLLSDTNNT